MARKDPVTTTADRCPDLLRTNGQPLFFEVGNLDRIGLEPPADRHGQSLRTWARVLSGMQKEAIVHSARSGKSWRLASDEGPYLNGNDSAPCPLAFLTTGMVASYMTETLALARKQSVSIRDIVIVQDNYYTMEGSALRGTMIGGALPVELDVRIDSDVNDAVLTRLLARAVRTSPVYGLLREAHESLFTLSLNSRQIEIANAKALSGSAAPDPGDRLSSARPAAADYSDLVSRQRAVEPRADVEGGAGSSLQASQSRTLHVRGTCRLLPDGRKEVVQELLSPIGSTFRFMCDEVAEFGGPSGAPDAATYLAAGIAFCFMTQFGRYASIVKKDLEHYRIVQDTHFSPGGEGGNGTSAGFADPVETHVYLDTEEGEAFARTALDMAERTCFLHALCRTPLRTRVRITRR